MSLSRRKFTVIFIIALIATSLFLSGSNIKDLFNNREWGTISQLFSDNTYMKFKEKLTKSLSSSIIKINNEKLKYYIEYEGRVEVGYILLKSKNGEYNNLNIKTTIDNLKFINKFKRYRIENKILQIGDAVLKIKEGNAFIAESMNRVIFFYGNYSIKILPNDIEERKTLNILYGKKHYFIEKKRGIFILPVDSVNEIFRDKYLKNGSNILEEEYANLKSQIKLFKDIYGVEIAGFKRLFFQNFSDLQNIMIFKRGKLIYKLVYNRNIVPDTYFIELGAGKHILNYNRIKIPKFNFETTNRVKKIQLYLRINPIIKKIWVRALLLFPKPSNIKSFELYKGMKIHGFFKEGEKDLDYIKEGSSFHIIGDGFDEFSFFYSGVLPELQPRLEIMKYKFKNLFGKLDEFLFLDNVNKFYPNPGNQFFKSTLKISIPKNINALASGYFILKKTIKDRKELFFKTDGTKGITVVCGDFTNNYKLDSKIPLNIYGSKGIIAKRFFKLEEIKKSFNFLHDIYGKRGIKSVNLLLRRWMNYGGVSYKGFIVLNIVKRNNRPDVRKTIVYYKSNPVYLTNRIIRDNLVHELAHQWWGGIISWKTYRDVWITEGGAQFSLLLYLQEKFSKSKFNRIINKICKRAIKDSVFGPISYGRRIMNLTNDNNTYQSIIYNKSALVFLMLKDMIGDKKFFKIINGILTKFNKKSISTGRFIKEFVNKADNSELIRKFLNGWIYFRDIPILNYRIKINDKNAVILFRQNNDKFVYPVEIIVESKNEKLKKITNYIIKGESQKFLINGDNIRSVKVKRKYSPIILKRMK